MYYILQCMHHQFVYEFMTKSKSPFWSEYRKLIQNNEQSQLENQPEMNRTQANNANVNTTAAVSLDK